MNKYIQILSIVLLSMFVFENSLASENDELWKLLQTEPNLVVLMRHAQPKLDGGDPRHWDKSGQCKNERILSEEGKAYASRLGSIFTKKSISPKIISSPMCRTLATAKLAFGKNIITDPLLREISSASDEKRQHFSDKAKELLIENTGIKPIVFISHRPNIEVLSFELISVTELIVGSVDVNGDIEVIGIIKN